MGVPLQVGRTSLLYSNRRSRDKARAGRGTIGDKTGNDVAEGTVPIVEIGANKCAGGHGAFMAIRYNRGFCRSLLLSRVGFAKQTYRQSLNRNHNFEERRREERK